MNPQLTHATARRSRTSGAARRIACWVLMAATSAGASAALDVIDISNRLQLFLDDALIDSKENVREWLHGAAPREVVIRADQPFEDGLMYDPTVIKDGHRYK